MTPRLLPVLLLLATAASFAATAPAAIAPSDFVTALYAQHKKKSPIYPAKDRALLDAWVAKPLADLIWKDAQSSSPDNVPVIDGDPLYDAQEFEIKDFEVHPAKMVKGEGRVSVTFTNYGKKRNLQFQLQPDGHGSWRVSDIRYSKNSTLLKTLTEQYSAK